MNELSILLTDTINRIKSDWNNNPYEDKYISYWDEYNGKSAKYVDYIFENGELISFIILEPESDEFIFETKIFKLNKSIKSFKQRFYLIIKSLLVEITNKSIKRKNKNLNNYKIILNKKSKNYEKWLEKF